MHLDFSVTALTHTSPKDPNLAPQVLLQETLVLCGKSNAKLEHRNGMQNKEVVFSQWDLTSWNLWFTPKHLLFEIFGV